MSDPQDSLTSGTGPVATNPFEPGDVVRLRSGGPFMTVACCESDESNGALNLSGVLVNCVWIRENGEAVAKPFFPLMLDLERRRCPAKPIKTTDLEMIGAMLGKHGKGQYGSNPENGDLTVLIIADVLREDDLKVVVEFNHDGSFKCFDIHEKIDGRWSSIEV